MSPRKARAPQLTFMLPPEPTAAPAPAARPRGPVPSVEAIMAALTCPAPFTTLYHDGQAVGRVTYDHQHARVVGTWHGHEVDVRADGMTDLRPKLAKRLRAILRGGSQGKLMEVTR